MKHYTLFDQNFFEGELNGGGIPGDVEKTFLKFQIIHFFKR